MKTEQYWQAELETMPREQLEQLQAEKLRRTITICLQSPFYKRVLGERGITPDSIKTIDDVRHLPFTTKQDLRDNYPFGLVGGASHRCGLFTPRHRIVGQHDCPKYVYGWL